MIIEFYNRCFYRDIINNRPNLKVGGPLCRVNKGYFETSLNKLCGYKTDIGFIHNDEEKKACKEVLTLYIPKEEIEQFKARIEKTL